MFRPALAALLAASFSAHADQVHIVARTGDPAPAGLIPSGVPGTIVVGHSALMSPGSLGPGGSGQVAVGVGTANTPAGTPLTVGVLQGRRGEWSVLAAQTADALSGVTAPAFIDSRADGHLVFTISRHSLFPPPPNSPNFATLFLAGPDVAGGLISLGTDRVPVPPTTEDPGFWVQFAYPAASRAGNAVFRHDQSLFAVTGGIGPAPVFLDGETYAGGVMNTSAPLGAMNRFGELLVSGTQTQAGVRRNVLIHRPVGQAPAVIFTANGSAVLPGTAQVVSTFRLSVQINDSGLYSVIASSGSWSGLAKGRDGSLESWLSAGDPAPGLPGRTVSSIATWTLATEAPVAVSRVSVTPSTPNHDIALVRLHEGAPPQHIFLKGDPLPGGAPGDVMGSAFAGGGLSFHAISPDGRFAVLGVYTGLSVDANGPPVAAVIFDGRLVRALLREGSVLPDSGFPDLTLDRLHVEAVSDDGRVLVTSIGTGSNPSAVLEIIADISCPADFDRSGGNPTVQDLFDYLAACFSNRRSADINQDGIISVQDIFDFLGAYFATC